MTTSRDMSAALWPARAALCMSVGGDDWFRRWPFSGCGQPECTVVPFELCRPAVQGHSSSRVDKSTVDCPSSPGLIFCICVIWGRLPSPFSWMEKTIPQRVVMRIQWVNGYKTLRTGFAEGFAVIIIAYEAVLGCGLALAFVWSGGWDLYISTEMC